MNGKYLLMGGPADGQRVAMRTNEPWWKIASANSLRAFDELKATDTIDHEVHTYTRREMAGGNTVFAHVDTPTHQIVPTLIAKYSHQSAEEVRAKIASEIERLGIMRKMWTPADMAKFVRELQLD